MNRTEKEDLLQDLKSQFGKAKAAYLTRFTGLTVMSMDDLRKKVHGAGGKYQVVKNTMAELGTEGTPYKALTENLAGAMGWALTDKDPVALAKVLKAFLKDNEKFAIERGMLDGKQVDAKGIQALADMPPKEVLLAKILGTLNNPAREIVTVLSAVPRQLVTVIDQIRKKKEENKNG